MIAYALTALAFAALLGSMFFAGVLADRLLAAHRRGMERVRWYIPRQHDHEERDMNGARW